MLDCSGLLKSLELLVSVFCTFLLILATTLPGKEAVAEVDSNLISSLGKNLLSNVIYGCLLTALCCSIFIIVLHILSSKLLGLRNLPNCIQPMQRLESIFSMLIVTSGLAALLIHESVRANWNICACITAIVLHAYIS
ncbi:hypothetical protein Ciccas_007736 [Cichlidogyrus casuarinus]|uniref:Uncharacterized protein n=1 Tax=Cichlidogyrus casuarinus TaxID=1844966 RepID=A0ABD2Q271_9PLAT